MLEFLPDKIYLKIKDYINSNLTEVRIRVGKEITLIYNGKKIKINHITNKFDIEEAVLRACKRSIYSYDEQIKQGFITTDNGERIGLSGELVFNGNGLLGMRDYTSLCIRIPHEISGVSDNFFNNIYKGGSVLVVSKTGIGKTTFIRDFCKNLSNKLNVNVVVVDERNELAGKNNNFSFDLGDNTDVLTYSNKTYGLNQAIRALNPVFAITDEIISECDANSVNFAINSGVNVIATTHADSIGKLKSKTFLSCLINDRCFDYYLLIKIENNTRKIDVYDKNLAFICGI